METPDYQKVFDTFKNGIFEYLIKPDLIRSGKEFGVEVTDVILWDDYSVNSHTGKIYPMFVVEYKSEGYYPRLSLQSFLSERIKSVIDKFYPSNEFTILGANIVLKKL